jgi:nuclear pore complex protein Nup155
MAIQQNLSNLTFKDLFVSPDAKEIAKKLVTALIEQQIGQELGVSPVQVQRP